MADEQADQVPFSMDALLAARREISRTELTGECERVLALAREERAKALAEGPNPDAEMDEFLDDVLTRLLWTSIRGNKKVQRLLRFLGDPDAI